MQLDETLSPWIDQLEGAFKPYSAFVDEVTGSLVELEKTRASLLIALAHAEAESNRLNQVLEAHREAQALAMANAMAQESNEGTAEEEETQHKFQAFVVEIATLKSQLQSQMGDLQNKQVRLETLKVQLEEQASARKNQQTKLEDYQTNAKTQDLLLQDARAQIETLKLALNEAKTSVSREVQNNRNDREIPVRASAPREAKPKAPTLPERMVLLVDDAEINRVLMSHYFKGLPVKLHFAISITAAMQKCKEHAFDLVVVDDEIQGLDNSEFTKGSQKLVALSNRGSGHAEMHPEFQHVLNRGQSREEFVEQLKSFLWSA